METAVELTDDISEADALLALQAKIRKNPRIKSLATSHGIPVYVTKVKIKSENVLFQVFLFQLPIPKEALFL